MSSLDNSMREALKRHIGSEIAELCGVHMISAEDLADELNANKTDVLSWISGSTIPPAETLWELGWFFGVPVGYFYPSPRTLLEETNTIWELDSFLLKEAGAPSNAHEHLRMLLGYRASELGFSQTVKWPFSLARPDVVKQRLGGRTLFFGDAKLKHSQPARDVKSQAQLHRYINEFASFLDEGWYHNACIAICTDDSSQAYSWKIFLEKTCTDIGLVNVSQNVNSTHPIQFNIERYHGAWIVLSD